jgi:hypothetical protein
MKQLLVVLLIALVFSLLVASHSFSVQMREDSAPRPQSNETTARLS